MIKKQLAIILLLLPLAFISPAQSIIVKTTKHPFSDPGKLDVFSLSLTGKSILNGTLTFKITTSANKEIFKEEFPSTDFLGDMEDVLSDTQKINTITQRLNHFFDEENFKKPAIAASAEYDKYTADSQTWMDIKSDKNAVGFLYSHGYESTYGIAYSKKDGKVVQYFYIE